ncbi:MAG: hypothetical protein ABJA98_12460 [Acidobacteriota bacterium]
MGPTNIARHCDHRDLVIAELADSEALLRQRIASLEADVAIYREISQAGIHALHNLTVQLGRLRQQHERLVVEYRGLLAQLHQQAA